MDKTDQKILSELSKDSSISIPKLAEKEIPNKEALDSQLLYSEPKGLNIDTGLPEMKKERFKQGVYY